MIFELARAAAARLFASLARAAHCRPHPLSDTQQQLEGEMSGGVAAVSFLAELRNAIETDGHEPGNKGGGRP